MERSISLLRFNGLQSRFASFLKDFAYKKAVALSLVQPLDVTEKANVRLSYAANAWKRSEAMERLEEYMKHDQSITSQGLVLYNRNFREDDKLVKIFTSKRASACFSSNTHGQTSSYY